MSEPVDREQIRRDAEWAEANLASKDCLTRELARACLALLTELEQADKHVERLHDHWEDEHKAALRAEAERDEYRRRDHLTANEPLAESLLFRDPGEMTEDQQAVAAYVGQKIARLAKVPALVEALRSIDDDRLPWDRARRLANAALAEWERNGGAGSDR